eukprot:96623-Pyramimonas_sp.AAC.1
MSSFVMGTTYGELDLQSVVHCVWPGLLVGCPKNSCQCAAVYRVEKERARRSCPTSSHGAEDC